MTAQQPASPAPAKAEPTAAMTVAGMKAAQDYLRDCGHDLEHSVLANDVYNAMLAAAPPAPPDDALAREEAIRSAINREARDNLFSGDELDAANNLSKEICDYIERGRTDLHLDGAIRAGVDHIFRHKVLPMLADRPKLLLAALKALDAQGHVPSAYEREGKR